MVSVSLLPSASEDDDGEITMFNGVITTELPGMTVTFTDEAAETLNGAQASTETETLYHTGEVPGAVQLS
jgi:hypothetical protein